MVRGIKIVVLLAVGLLSLALSSCRRDATEDRNPIVKCDKILFDISFDSEWVEGEKTKAVETQRVASLKFGSDSLLISCTVEPNRVPTAEAVVCQGEGAESVEATEPQSRGAAITTNSLATYYVTAKLNNTQTYFADHEISVVEAVQETPYMWTSSNLNFMAYSPQAAKPSSFAEVGGEWTGSFNYTLPEPNLTTDAEAQPDFIFALRTDVSRTTEAVELQFHHAFAALNFKVGTMPANVKVHSISLQNIYSTASCDFKATASDLLFTWDSHTSQATYTQQFDKDVTNGAQINSTEQTFMVVPQTLPANAELSIKFDISGREYTLTHTFAELGITGWDADKVYTYTLSTCKEIELQVTDTVSADNKVKNSLKIQNIGLAEAYIRAAIVGWWEKEIDGEWQCIMSWDDNNLATPVYGQFNWGSSWGSYWTKHTDGYYYYKDTLERYESTAVPLFESYTVTAPAPALYAELRLVVVVQAVIVNDTGKAEWSHLATLFP